MQNKRLLILEKALYLFATKGFHSTSVQEIAEHAGISKGGVYSYFTSKNELLMEIYKYYYHTLRQEISSIVEKNQDPKKQFQMQIQVYMQELLSKKEFILMHIKENVHHHHELGEFLSSVTTDTYEWYTKMLKEIYGDEVLPYKADLSIIVHGIIEAYLITLFRTNTALSIEKLSAFIISRLDDIVEGLLRKKEETFIQHPLSFSDLNFCEQRQKKDVLHRELEQIRSIVLDEVLPDTEKKEYLETIDFLKEEAKQEKPKKIVFQAMLKSFTSIPGTSPMTERILQLLHNEKHQQDIKEVHT